MKKENKTMNTPKKPKTLLEAKTEPLTEEATRLYLSCVMGDAQHGDDAIPEDYDGSQAHNIVQKRLDAAGADVSRWVVSFVATMCQSPGDCVLWAHALKTLGNKVGRVDMQELTNAFPMGFPSESERRSCWDSQKGYNLGLEKVDNYLDTKEAWA